MKKQLVDEADLMVVACRSLRLRSYLMNHDYRYSQNDPMHTSRSGMNLVNPHVNYCLCMMVDCKKYAYRI